MGRISSTKVQYGTEDSLEQRIVPIQDYKSRRTLISSNASTERAHTHEHTSAFASDSHNTSRLKGGLRSQSHKRITFKEELASSHSFPVVIRLREGVGSGRSFRSSIPYFHSDYHWYHHHHPLDRSYVRPLPYLNS